MHDASDSARVLAAGGIAPRGAKLAEGERAGSVGARAFTHPALPGRAVVRLTTEAMAPGVDVEMETLGFGAPKATPDLGWQRYRALGFPGWALVHDPARAKFALEVMKEFKKAAARVKSKPGHARDAFVAIGDRLARSVPHFLPSFWEEAGRAFLAEDSTSFAAQAFEKARTTEKEHGLPVDEETRGAVFLEFALAGAVAAKTLSAYAKVLEKSYGAKDAYPRFFELARRRTLGGMPPWSGMSKDLRALAKAAKLDEGAEDERFLAETLDAPALALAPTELWSSYDEALVRLAKRDPAKRDRLRHVFPKPPRGGDEQKAAWLGVLDRAGALDAVIQTSGDEAKREAHGMAAEWLGKALAWAPLHPAVAALVPRMAERLKSEGIAVQLAQGNKWHSLLNLDACEHALALGVPVDAPLPNARFALDKPFTVDPVHVAADPRFAKLLEDAVGAQMGQAEFEAAAKGKRGFVAARRAWVEARIAEASKGSLVTFVTGLTQIEQRTSAATFAEFPELKETFLRLDVAKGLACQLRGGHVTELTWPAFEQAIVDLGGKPTSGGFFPYPVLYTSAKAIVLGARGRLLEHDLRVPQGANLREVFFVPDSAAGDTGQLLVAYWDAKASKMVAYWSGAPSDVFDWEAEGYYGSAVARVPGGPGISFGGRAFVVGDTRAQRGRPPVSDGAKVWIVEQTDYQQPQRLREIDPKTGDKGAFSFPAAMAGFEGVHLTGCTLQALPPGVTASPLGSKGGACGGFTFRDAATGTHTYVGADGRRWEKVTGPYEHPPTGLVTMPGDARPRAIRDQSYWARVAVHLADPDGWALGAVGEGAWTFAGWPAAPPSSLWHFAAARDEAASAALRATSDELARSLLDRARPAAASGATNLEEAERAVAELVPAITDPKLRGAVAAVVHEAAIVSHWYDRVVKSHVEATPQGAVELDAVDDGEVRDALGRLVPATWERGSVSRALAAISEWLDGGKLAELPMSGIHWEHLLGRVRSLATFAISPGATEAQRRAAARLLGAWQRTTFARDPGAIRFGEATMTDASPFMRKDAERVVGQWVSESGASRYFVRVVNLGNLSAGTPRTFHFVERTSDGTFRDPPGTSLVRERRAGATPDAEWLEGFLAALAERGAPAWDPAAADDLAKRTGLTRTEAALLWASLPKVDDYAADFLGKELRTTLGLKQGDAKAARDTFRGLPFDARLDLFAAAASGGDPRALFAPLAGGDDGPVARLAAAWVARSGQRVELREELVVACEKALDLPHSAAVILGALMSPTEAKCLAARAEYGVAAAFAWQKPKPEDGFDHRVARSVAQLVPWLFTELPVGDPYRAALRGLWEVVRARLLDPKLVAPLESRWGEPKELVAAIDALGGDAISDPSIQHGRDNGLVRAELHTNTLRSVFRPSKVKRYADEPALVKMASAGNAGALAAIAFLLEAVPAFLDRVDSTPVPAGQYEANPALSAPATVAAAKKKLRLTDGAAALYVQVLTLAEPTQKNVILWNGWKPAEYKKAAEALAVEKLVVVGKRERAGREIFLPGGWEKRGGNDLPLETWKLPLYELAHGSIGRLLPPKPLHVLFGEAWARVEKGDAPKYEEV